MRLPLTIICDSQRHCTACRDRDGGRAWRESLLSYYDAAGTGADFACPRGKQWGEITSLPFATEGTESSENPERKERAGFSPSPLSESSVTSVAKTDWHRSSDAESRMPNTASALPCAEEICLVCADRACPNVTACCGGRLIVHIQAPCKRDIWTVEPSKKNGKGEPHETT